MITISKSQLRQVEYLIQQSLQGNHVLFDAASLREAVTLREARCHHPEKNESLSTSDAGTIERHIETLITLPSLPQKRAYLERLPTEEYQALVQSYLNIIENNLLERGQVRH